jgi:predicted dithiol-disulfide oxidoreductase (DUF899 family)
MNEEIEALEKEMVELSERIFAARARAEPELFSDFTFETAVGTQSLTELFGDKSELVLIHNMGKTCPYCTMWADNLEGSKRHIESRCALVLVSPDPADVQAKLAAARGWTFRMATDATKEFTSAMGFWSEGEGWWPGVSTFRKNDDGTIVRTGKAIFGPGDSFCPAWHFFRLLGIGESDWTPS